MVHFNQGQLDFAPGINSNKVALESSSLAEKQIKKRKEGERRHIKIQGTGLVLPGCGCRVSRIAVGLLPPPGWAQGPQHWATRPSAWVMR